MATPEEHQELLLLYETTVNDLAYYRVQQWSVTNHCFFLLAALAGIRQLMGTDIAQFDLIALTTITLIIAFVGLIVISRLQNAVERRDARLENTAEKFSEEFKTIWDQGAKYTPKIKMFWFLYLALIIGMLIVIRIIYI